MVSSADKYRRLGVVTADTSVTEDDIDKLAINYKDLTVDTSSLTNTADVTIENTSSTDTITETVVLRRNSVAVDRTTVEIASSTTVTVTFVIQSVLFPGQYTYEAGRDGNIVSDTVTIRQQQ